jgi:hypothetical protein
MRPDTLASTDLGLMRQITEGAEIRVLVAPAESYLLGSELLTGSGTGTFTADTIGAAQLTADPREVVVMFDNDCPDAYTQDIVLTGTGTDADAGAFSDASASFALPSYVLDRTRSYPRCYGTDLVTANSKKVKTLTAVSVACSARAKNSRLLFFGVPSYAAFTAIGCIEEKDFNLRMQEAQAFACGLNASSSVQPGMIVPGNLSVSAKNQTVMNGLARYAGRKVTVLLEVRRLNRVITERYLFINTTFGISYRGPGDAGAVMESISGIAEETIILTAPTA